MEFGDRLVGPPGDARLLEHAFDPVPTPDLRHHEERRPDDGELQERNGVVADDPPIDRCSGDPLVLAIERRDVAHVFVGVTTAEAREIPVGVADVGDLEVEQGDHVGATRHELAGVAAQEAHIVAVGRRVAAQPHLQEGQRRVDVPRHLAHGVHAVHGVQGDVAWLARGVGELLHVGELTHRYGMHRSEVGHVAERGLPAFGVHLRRRVHRGVEHPGGPVFGFDPVHDEGDRFVHPAVDVRDEDAVAFEDLHACHLEAQCVDRRDRPVAAHEHGTGLAAARVRDLPLWSPAFEPLHGDDLAAQVFGDPRLDTGAALRLERFVVDRVFCPRHGVIVGPTHARSPKRRPRPEVVRRRGR